MAVKDSVQEVREDLECRTSISELQLIVDIEMFRGYIVKVVLIFIAEINEVLEIFDDKLSSIFIGDLNDIDRLVLALSARFRNIRSGLSLGFAIFKIGPLFFLVKTAVASTIASSFTSSVPSITSFS